MRWEHIKYEECIIICGFSNQILWGPTICKPKNIHITWLIRRYSKYSPDIFHRDGAKMRWSEAAAVFLIINLFCIFIIILLLLFRICYMISRVVWLQAGHYLKYFFFSKYLCRGFVRFVKCASRWAYHLLFVQPINEHLALYISYPLWHGCPLFSNSVSILVFNISCKVYLFT